MHTMVQLLVEMRFGRQQRRERRRRQVRARPVDGVQVVPDAGQRLCPLGHVPAEDELRLRLRPSYPLVEKLERDDWPVTVPYSLAPRWMTPASYNLFTGLFTALGAVGTAGAAASQFFAHGVVSGARSAWAGSVARTPPQGLQVSLPRPAHPPAPLPVESPAVSRGAPCALESAETPPQRPQRQQPQDESDDLKEQVCQLPALGKQQSEAQAAAQAVAIHAAHLAPGAASARGLSDVITALPGRPHSADCEVRAFFGAPTLYRIGALFDKGLGMGQRSPSRGASG